MNSYKIICECFDNFNVVKEDALTGGAAGLAVGGLATAFNEWLIHWVKELKNVILTSENPQQVKDWYDKNITDDDSIYWSRKGFLRLNYYAKAIDRVIESNDPLWRDKLLRRCNKTIFLNRALCGIYTVALGLHGAHMGSIL